MESIDISVFQDGNPATADFVGTLFGGGQVETSFTTTSGSLGLETFSFAGLGFEDLVKLEFGVGDTAPDPQYDNITVVPEPGWAALQGAAMAALVALRRLRRAERQ